MANITRVGFVTVLSVALFVGCSKSTPSNTSASVEEGSGDAAAQNDFSNNPIAQVATEFINAVMKGDTQRGMACLTPQARDKVGADGTFDPSGMENPQSQIVGVRLAPGSPDFAFAQYVFGYTSRGRAEKEDMACALRRVNDTWYVYGLIHGTGPGKPFNFHNFETGKDTPVLLDGLSDGGPQGVNMASRPSPPRTGQETPATSPTAERR